MANYAILCHLIAGLANPMLLAMRPAIQPDSLPEPAEMKAHPTSRVLASVHNPLKNNCFTKATASHWQAGSGRCSPA
jgi:hypothetical protein